MKIGRTSTTRTCACEASLAALFHLSYSSVCLTLQYLNPKQTLCVHLWRKHGALCKAMVREKKSPQGENSHSGGRNSRIPQMLLSGLSGSSCHQKEPKIHMAALPIQPYSDGGADLFFMGFFKLKSLVSQFSCKLGRFNPSIIALNN